MCQHGVLSAWGPGQAKANRLSFPPRVGMYFFSNSPAQLLLHRLPELSACSCLSGGA